jgi:putative Mn2+ efflux pump MntP
LIAQIVVLAALGLDTIAVAISFGLAGIHRSRWLRVALVVALYSVLMPVIGLLAGESLSDRGASAAVYLAGLGLIGAGIYGLCMIPSAGQDEALVVENVLEEDVIDEEKLQQPSSRLSTQTLHVTAILGSVDKLAVGLALGATDVRPVGALIYLAIQSFVLALLGISFGKRLGATLGHRAEVLSKFLLIGIGALIIASQLFDLKFITDG